jgi:hypothetical protein
MAQIGAGPKKADNALFERAPMSEQPFKSHREAALTLLWGPHRLSRKAGQFLGQLAVDASPMSEAQADWLAKLLERADLPQLGAGGAQRASPPL